MPLTSWFRGADYRPPEKCESIVVAESLLLELDTQMKEIERISREKEQEDKMKNSCVDYTWLISAPSKSFEMPQIQRLEIEELCSKVKPQESGKVITRFREILLRKPCVEEIPPLFKAVLQQVLQERPKEESLGEWVLKRTASLTKLKPSLHTRVYPFGGSGSDNESTGTDETEMTETRRVMSLPEFTNSPTQNSRYNSLPAFCANMDELPV
ncbi:protein RD3-like [Saccoglossus kowalevskii]|uniref:Protein RD3-like n=1 Tax=Saccoglossus kowalevskii TaxID=10224 RepID=A0ABM0GUV3_SACKO|nr:PREDICTED: protein RD3-like [Saccoglossus kowalevskii]